MKKSPTSAGALLLLFIVALSGCYLSAMLPGAANTPPASSPPPSGMIAGRVPLPYVANNQVLWKGVGNAVVDVGGNSSVTTVADGTYLAANVPTGSYNIQAKYSLEGYTGQYGVYEYVSPARGAIVLADHLTVALDLQLIPNSLGSGRDINILYGKIYHSNKVTPYGGLRVYLRDIAYNTSTSDYFPWDVLGSTTTSSDGSYAFQLDTYGRMLSTSTDSTVEMKFLATDSIPYDYLYTLADGGIVQADAYTLTQ